MQQMTDLYTYRLKRRLLVSCLTTLIGGPLMCCGLFGLFNFVLPAIDQADPKQFPVILVLGGLGMFSILSVITLAVIAVYLKRRKFPGIDVSNTNGSQSSEGLSRFRQISLIVLVFGMPLCFIVIGVIAYLSVTLFR